MAMMLSGITNDPISLVLPSKQDEPPSGEALASETQSLFASQLAQVDALTQAQEKQMESETVQSTQIQPMAQSKATQEEEKTTAPKIARSWRMASAEKATEVGEDTTLGWGDFIDLINPLQHIPIIGTLYREATGDTIKPEVQIAGNVLLGVATGSIAFNAIAGIVTAIYEEHSGQEATVQVAQALFGDGDTVGSPSPAAGDVQLDYGKTINVAEAAVAAEKEKATREHLQKGAEKTETIVLPPRTKTASSRGMRIGSTLYPAQARPISRITAQTARTETPPAQKLTEESLGTMMQEQAQVRAAGGELSPNLVQDMMLMALDKYQAAQALNTGDARRVVQ